MKGASWRTVETGNYTDKDYEALLDTVEKAQYRSKFPQTIVFDWNGTIDSRGIGNGIPLQVLDRLKTAGITVIVFTSSVLGEDKLFMRQVLTQHGIPYTDKEKILSHADMFVGDKNSDKRRAGYYGCKFVLVDEFDDKKILSEFDPDKKYDTPYIPQEEWDKLRQGSLMNPSKVEGGGGSHSTANTEVAKATHEHYSGEFASNKAKHRAVEEQLGSMKGSKLNDVQKYLYAKDYEFQGAGGNDSRVYGHTSGHELSLTFDNSDRLTGVNGHSFYVDPKRPGYTPMKKQYPDIGSGIGVMYGDSLKPNSQGGQYLPQKPEEPTTTIGDNNQGAGTREVSGDGMYPANPQAMQGPTDQAGFNPVTMPKLQASGDPASTYGIQNQGGVQSNADAQDTKLQDYLNVLAGRGMADVLRRVGESVTMPGMDRTVVGDKWKYEYDLQHYNQNGVPYLQATLPSHWDLLDRLFGSREFVRNDIAAGLDKRRFENKMTGEYAWAQATPDNTIEVQVFDRTGRLLATLPDYANMQMYLQQAYPLPDDDMLKSMEFDGRIEGIDQLRRRRDEINQLFSQGFPREDTHAHFAGEFPSQKTGRALSAIEQKMAQGHSGSTVFLNQNPSVAIDAYSPEDQHALGGAVANYPPDSYVVARTNYTMDQAKADPRAVDTLSQEVQGNQNVHDLTVGSWTGDDGKAYVDYGVVVSGKANAMNMARQWNQQGVFQLKDAQGNVAPNYIPTEGAQEEGGPGSGRKPYKDPAHPEGYGYNPTPEQQTQGQAIDEWEKKEGRPVTTGAGTHGHYPGDPEAQTAGQGRKPATRSRVGAVAGIGGTAALGGAMMAMGPHAPHATPIGQQLQQARPTGPRPQTQAELAHQALMQARQSVGAPVTGRPQMQVPGMHGQAVTTPTGLAPTTGKPIVPPHGAMFASQSPYSTTGMEEGNEGNEILRPDGTIETGRAGDAILLRRSFRKLSELNKVENNGTQ